MGVAIWKGDGSPKTYTSPETDKGWNHYDDIAPGLDKSRIQVEDSGLYEVHMMTPNGGGVASNAVQVNLSDGVLPIPSGKTIFDRRLDRRFFPS